VTDESEESSVTFETKVTNAGTEYKVIMPSSTQVYEYVEINNAGNIDGENDHWMIYLTKSEVVEKGFPLNANPRKPNSVGTDESKDIVLKMEATINTNPKDFVRLNNGMTGVASKVELDVPEKGKITVKWNEMEGILNGGHTYLALQNKTCPPTHETLTKVKLELIELNAKYLLEENSNLKTDWIKQTAISRNANRQLKDYTQSEFEGLHEIFQSHLDGWKGVVYWSEGYENIAVNKGKTIDEDNPIFWTEKQCMTSYAFIRYLAILDKSWHWHPTGDESDNYVAPSKNTIINELIVKGATTYNEWKNIAALPSNEKNLQNIAPLSRVLLALHDRITDSMDLKKNSQGKTTNPTGCGSSFTTMKVFNAWCGKGPGKKLKLTDLGETKTATSTPHFIGYMLNYVRPFIWFGDIDDEKSFVGFYRDPIEIYDEFHKTIIKKFMTVKYDDFDSGRDMCKDGLYGLDNWDSYIKPIWDKYCSVNPEDDNFFPMSFYDYDTEKWFGKDNGGSNCLVFDDISKGWRIEPIGYDLDEDEVSRIYKEIDRPY